ncbi:MAG: hypothetical protein E7294_00205 [Lachnospiraceae bacterium]|nr:hypothetical protein [Lachnospiraceae bacterium]
MTGMEIVLLAVGFTIFLVGFLMPKKNENVSEQVRSVAQEEVKKALEGQFDQTKGRMNDMADETVTHSVEKTERAMERLSNEKIFEITDYSNTVLSDIEKNHKEVVFLYDMLQEKQEAVKAAIVQADATVTRLNRTTDGINSRKQTEDLNEKEAEQGSFENKEMKDSGGFVEFKSEEVLQKNKISGNDKRIVQKDGSGKKRDNRRTRNAVRPERTGESLTGDSKQRGKKESTEQKNNNERILKLYGEGKSDVVIAKELGLGVGEVRLVIDLYKGMPK